ncbi:MAG: hypothetical protein ACK55Z_05095, partial [bacterium]
MLAEAQISQHGIVELPVGVLEFRADGRPLLPTASDGSVLVVVGFRIGDEQDPVVIRQQGAVDVADARVHRQPTFLCLEYAQVGGVV